MENKLVIDKRSQQICRLCLEKLTGMDGDEIDCVKIQMLKELSVDVHFEIVNDLIICCTCSEKLEQSFNFKIKCLNNENMVKAFHNSKEQSPVILEEVFPNPVLTDLPLKNEKTKVCRFCLKHFIMEECTVLDQLDNDIFLQDLISKTVSEMDFSLTVEPVICSECMEALQVLFNFNVGCFDANEIIRNYVSSFGQDKAKSIDLLKVFDFMSNLRMEDENTCNLNHIKTEKDDWDVDNIVYDTNKEELSNEHKISNIDDKETGDVSSNTNSNPFFIELHQIKQKRCYNCYHCPYKTTNRSTLILHLLVHKKSSEIPRLKCNLCNFETIWRTSLRTHMLLHKDKSELIIYKCDKCKYQSKYKKHLRRHMETHNTKKYQCEDCPFMSKNLRNFKTHCERHHIVKDNQNKCSKMETKVKTEYKCSHCSYKTLKFCRIKEHIVKHMNQDETPSYKCDLCNFQTKYKASLSHHKKTHKKKEVKLEQQM